MLFFFGCAENWDFEQKYVLFLTQICAERKIGKIHRFSHECHFWSDFSMQFTFSQIIWSWLFSRYHLEHMFYYVNECVSGESSEWTFENMDVFTSATEYLKQFAYSTIMNVCTCHSLFAEFMWMQVLNVLNINNIIWIVRFWRELWMNWLNVQYISMYLWVWVCCQIVKTIGNECVECTKYI